MKYGANIFIWVDEWGPGEIGLFARAKSLGLHTLEITIGEEVDFVPHLIRAASEELEMGVVISPGGIWPMEADISHEEKRCRTFGVSWHRKWLEAGAKAGARAYAGALYAHPGRVERRAPSRDEFMYAAENLNLLAGYASGLGMDLVLEPMSHFRTHLINTPRQLMELIRAADHEALKVLLDTYHLVTEVREYESGIRMAGDRLWGIHACENDRGIPGGGLVPWDSIFSTLLETGFDGHIILESYNSSVGEFAYSRGMFHNVCPDGDEFVRKGTGFIRETIRRLQS